MTKLDVASSKWSDDKSSAVISSLTGSRIGSGISQSADGKVSINWDTGEAFFSDGVRGRVFLGKIPGTNDYGIKIVDAEGNVVMSSSSLLQTAGLADEAVTSGKISVAQLDALAINTGTLNVDESMTLGDDDNVKIDGANKRIIINDGTDDRILIGWQEGGF